MQLQQLAYFVAVADARHFTRAAELSHVSQPSLSQQIRALERELGAELFHRSRSGTALTDAGEALLPLARRILADADSARRAVAETVQLRRGRVRFGAPPSLCASLVPQVLRAYRARHPGVDLRLTEGGSGDLVRDLEAGQLDLALVIAPATAPPAPLDVTPLLHEDLVLVSATPLPRRARITDLRGQDLVMFREGYDVRESTLAACRAAGFEPSYAVEGGEMDAVLAAVRAGLGPAVVPGMVAASSGLPATPFAPPGLGRTIALAHGRDLPLTHAAAAFHATLLAYLREADRTDTLPPGTRLLR
ncbi:MULTISPECIES: LysR substrate-binding domain-containing protein [Kitasatospora]|uniref:Putative LysR family transcriptional regulator n=1 Tax=Kitasatospora setae (strain ATCC 33774 / DSM 43861 / JCM 3304 / KCC A-0304 / NBRC 14216 / KM-6054) TaxID=452652 RepID=E4NJ03_KITSK|nr:LysR substrate-binding domain-containing protein [Kitasatospora setae]BAJ32951.1 putative LysR family transcriptional regulator [Kitasatospora setae KM-6054]